MASEKLTKGVWIQGGDGTKTAMVQCVFGRTLLYLGATPPDDPLDANIGDPTNANFFKYPAPVVFWLSAMDDDSRVVVTFLEE